ncbi:MAG: sigma-54 dependent transcriptional regulator [Methylobacillus sp.]|jgi:DNA-binding NtrC family response regulator|nr:sigma-54 dependent transcriptional regulator [Methylobacillus sp.]
MQMRDEFSGEPSVATDQKSRVLLIEDETLFARAVAKRLRKAGYECEAAETLAEGQTIMRRFAPDIVLLDMRLPDGNGMDLLAELIARNIPVIVMTAYGEISDAVSAIKQGAADYLKKPVDLEELLLVVDKARRSEQIKHRLDYSRQRDSHSAENIEFIGDSSAMQTARMQIERIAQLVSVGGDTPPTVLITGETGTGKDVAARLLHQFCDRSNRPFVHVDCASLPAELVESELFGHEKGAFTSAQDARCGLIEAAEDGTLFMDEIGELPLALQVKLLNVLERRVVRRLGSTRERSVAARFIAATNRDLQQMVIEGRFRADLYYRLNVLNIEMPPLRQRGDDILLLANHFAQQTARRYGLPHRPFSSIAQTAMLAYSWPGNVRELKHLVSRGALLSQGAMIELADLALPGALADTPSLSAMRLEDAEKTLIINALKQSGGNVSEAARLLGITRMTIRYRMEKHGVRDQ